MHKLETLGIEQKPVVLLGQYWPKTEAAFLGYNTRTLEPSYMFCVWKDHDSIRLLHIRESDIVRAVDRESKLEIEYMYRFEQPCNVTDNPAKCPFNSINFVIMKENYKRYVEVLTRSGVNPPVRDD